MNVLDKAGIPEGPVLTRIRTLLTICGWYDPETDNVQEFSASESVCEAVADLVLAVNQMEKK